jgi:hypothetical protein
MRSSSHMPNACCEHLVRDAIGEAVSAYSTDSDESGVSPLQLAQAAILNLLLMS